ncbi:MAG: FAD-dependent oxidoreductase [Rhizobiaceae bacterium]|nr:FAD-dependent oxidoreductase [Rhizobiaceae bacterium]
MAESVVIIGAGQAGFSCAMRLRSKGFPGTVTILGDEPHFPYQRPPLSKGYVTGKTGVDGLALSGETAFADHGVTFLKGAAAQSVDANARSVTLKGGRAIGYDALVFATGSRARRLPDAMGMGLKGVHTLRGLADADALRDAVQDARHAVIIGGGFIGLEFAATLAAQGVTVTLLEAAPRILNRVAGETMSRLVAEKHRSHGVSIRTGVTLERLDGVDGRFTGVSLADGSNIAADLALVGIGGLANDELAAGAGLETKNGITVDAHARTADPAVYAAGDCALFPIAGTMMRLESVQNAIDQAHHVADEIMGVHMPYAPVPWFWSDQYDWKLQTAGLAVAPDGEIALQGHREGATAVWYIKHGRAIAVDTINDGKTHMAARRIFAAGHALTAADISAPDFDPVQVMRGLKN